MMMADVSSPFYRTAFLAFGKKLITSVVVDRNLSRFCGFNTLVIVPSFGLT